MSVPGSGTELFYGFCTAAAPLLIEYWLLNLTRRARRLKVIDLATKRLTFWSEYLKAVEVAGDRQQLRDEAFARILQVVEDADAELQGLSWVQKQSRLIAGEREKSPRKRRFRIRAPASMPESIKPLWRSKIRKARLWFILAIVCMLFASLLTWSLLAHLQPPQNVRGTIIGAVCFEAMALLSLWSREDRMFDAARLEYSLPTRPPKPPILDRI
jgi:hypothetical protein